MQQRIFFDKNNPKFSIIFGRFHVVKAMQKKMVEVFRTLNPADKRVVHVVLKEWVYALVHAKDLHSFDRRVKDASVVLLSEFYTPAVEKRLQRWKNSTARG